MNPNVEDASASARGKGQTFVVIEGVEVVPFSEIVARLCADYPGVPAAKIESILMREWEAFAAGRPLVVPAALEEGVREMLGKR
ncbi:three-helix bundle dimerization domain-containing protein [Microbacterium sp. P06]|uniref:three-helix bundle dimerization domain-containing protein n=1 Tax=unclassified Microbacterium TaxID=2609290 RepID=UPI00374672E2